MKAICKSCKYLLIKADTQELFHAYGSSLVPLDLHLIYIKIHYGNRDKA